MTVAAVAALLAVRSTTEEVIKLRRRLLRKFCFVVFNTEQQIQQEESRAETTVTRSRTGRKESLAIIFHVSV